MKKKKDDGTCARCGQVHQRCGAHNRKDGPCGNRPIPGGNVCGRHGGKAPQVMAKAKDRVVEKKAMAFMATYGLPVEISATDALTQELWRTAGHVGWLEDQIAQMQREDLTRGIKEVKLDGDDVTATMAAAPHVLLRLYQWEREHLVDVTTGALRAGVDERRVKLLEAQGEILGRGLLWFMVSFARALGVARMTSEQQQAAQELMRQLLTSLQAGEVPRSISA